MASDFMTVMFVYIRVVKAEFYRLTLRGLRLAY